MKKDEGSAIPNGSLISHSYSSLIHHCYSLVTFRSEILREGIPGENFLLRVGAALYVLAGEGGQG
jgi:hypothetical protein